MAWFFQCSGVLSLYFPALSQQAFVTFAATLQKCNFRILLLFSQSFSVCCNSCKVIALEGWQGLHRNLTIKPCFQGQEHSHLERKKKKGIISSNLSLQDDFYSVITTISYLHKIKPQPSPAFVPSEVLVIIVIIYQSIFYLRIMANLGA